MTPIRWTANFTVGWRTHLTYARRKSELLEWIDENVDLTGFSDNDDQLGIEIGGTHRLLVRPGGLSIHLMSRRSDVEHVQPAVAGILGIMEPVNASLDLYFAGWSAEISGEYEASRASFATRLSTVSRTPTMVAVDGSALVDFLVDGLNAQVEFGIVSAEELAFRLNDPTYGRVGPAHPLQRPPVRQLPESLPGASLFADVYLEQATSVASSAEVLAAVSAAEASALALVEALQAVI
jgi:hypothetical protein